MARAFGFTVTTREADLGRVRVTKRLEPALAAALPSGR
jgi:hypothetical protein